MWYQSYFRYLLSTTLFLFIPLLGTPITPLPSAKPQESIITLPIKADLTRLQYYLNQEIPTILATINEPKKACIKAYYLKLPSIPHCDLHGLKLSCHKDYMKIKLFPQINCKLQGWVKRDGNITLTGKGEKLHFKIPIKAEVSTHALPAMATASAILNLHTTPTINRDWSVSLDVAPDFKWAHQPTLTLMKAIKINIKGRVEPELKKRIYQFVNRIPQLLEEFDVQQKVSTLWKAIQEPLKLNHQTSTYLLFKPDSASYSGFTVVDNQLQTTIQAKGKTNIVIGDVGQECNKTALCRLSTIPCQAGHFHFDLPISIDYPTLEALSDQKLTQLTQSEHHLITLPGYLNISQTHLEKMPDNRLRVTARVVYDTRAPWLKSIDFLDWFSLDGNVTFSGTPHINQTHKALVVDDLTYESSSNNRLFDLLVKTRNLETLRSYFENRLTYQFGQELDRAIKKANRTIEHIQNDKISLMATLQLASIDQLSLSDEGVTITTQLSGTLCAQLE